MRHLRSTGAIALSLMLLAGCASEDAAGSADSAAGAPDAGALDDAAGGGSPDAAADATADAAGSPDSAGDAAADAGPGDAGPTDAGPTDAGPGDAGPGDAGPGDGGPTDAGPGPDVQAGACLSAAPSTLSYYVANPGTVEQKSVTLSSCGDEAVTLTGVSVEGGGNGEITVVDAEGLAGVVLPPGTTRTLTVSYAEKDDAIDGATVVVHVEAPAEDISIAVNILTWPDTCTEEIVSSQSAVLGAIVAADAQTLYVAGDPNTGAGFQLAEVDITQKTLTPVIALQSTWTLESWIRHEGSEVSVYEFYPMSQLHTYHRDTKQVTATPASDPTYPGPYEHGGSLFYAYVGAGDGDPCANVCILRDDQGDALPVELVDDGDEDFSIHTGAVYFVDGWVYFMTFQSVFNTPGPNALRRIALPGGPVEVVLEFDEPAVNAWVHAPVRASDGTLFWLRTVQVSLDAPGVAVIDRHVPSTGATEKDLVSGLGSDPSDLRLHEDAQLLWVDHQGLRTAPAAQGAAIETLVALPGPGAGSILRLRYTLADGRVYFTRTIGDGNVLTAVVGCVPLAP